jgi:hypothetical protein
MISNTFKVGPITCEMTISALGQLTAEWSPHMPDRLTRKERAQYRAGRDALLAEFAKLTGLNMLIIEI